MGYVGQRAKIPIGEQGLISDASHEKLPPDAIIRGKNFTIQNNVLEKEFGTEKLNRVALESGIVATFDWCPDGITQEQVCVLRNGKVFKIKNADLNVEVTAGSGAPATLRATDQVHIVEGGEELIW